MRIGVVSDTHDRVEAVAEAVRLLAEQRVELILHCGDIESPATVAAFAALPTHFVFGNWDKDRPKLTAAIKAIHGTVYESFGVLELAGKRVAWVHSHERHQLYRLEQSDYFDYLFYGHTHVREQHRTGRTLVANPGALFRANPKTCIVLDVTTGELKPIHVPVKSGDSTAGRPGLRDGPADPLDSTPGRPGLGALPSDSTAGRPGLPPSGEYTRRTDPSVGLDSEHGPR